MRDVEVIREARLQAREEFRCSPSLEHGGLDHDVRGEHRRPARQLPDVHVVNLGNPGRAQDVVADLGDLRALRRRLG